MRLTLGRYQPREETQALTSPSRLLQSPLGFPHYLATGPIKSAFIESLHDRVAVIENCTHLQNKNQEKCLKRGSRMRVFRVHLPGVKADAVAASDEGRGEERMNSTIQVTAAQLLIALVGAAAIGALVSSLINLFAQVLERKARKKELLLTKAVELTQRSVETGLKVAELTGIKSLQIEDPIVHTAAYYKWLEHLFQKGKLPDDKEIERIPEAQAMKKGQQ
jgi:hypothetical protein